MKKKIDIPIMIIVNYLFYANTNKAAREFTNQEILDHPVLYPDNDALDKCEYFVNPDTDSNPILNQIWAELKPSKDG